MGSIEKDTEGEAGPRPVQLDASKLPRGENNCLHDPKPIHCTRYQVLSAEAMASVASSGASSPAGEEVSASDGVEAETAEEQSSSAAVAAGESGDIIIRACQTSEQLKLFSAEDDDELFADGVQGPVEPEAEMEDILSPIIRRVRDDSSISDDFDWEGTTLAEPSFPSLLGVHKIAVEVMRRSFGSVEGDPNAVATREALDALRRERAGRDEDDDGMFEEEQSLTTKAADLQQSLIDVSVYDIDVSSDEDGPYERNGEGLNGESNGPRVRAAAGAQGHPGNSNGSRGGATGRHGKGGQQLPPAAAAVAAAAEEVASPAAAGVTQEGYPGRRSRNNGERRRRQGGKVDVGDVGGDAGMGSSVEGVEETGDDDFGGDGFGGDGGLMTRAIARRPLREMLRLEEEAVDIGEPVARLEHLPVFTERWAPEALTPFILGQVFSGLVPVASNHGQAEPVCTYMLECCVRPDMDAVTILHVASLVAANHGLELVRKRGSQVLYGVAPPTANTSPSHSSSIILPPSPGSPAPAAAAAPPSPSASGPPSPTAPGAAATVGRASSSRASNVSPAEKRGKGWGGAIGESTELRGWWGAGGAGWGAWSHVDLQLVVGQASKHRVLLIRFVTSRTVTSRDVFRLAAAAAENGEPLAIAPAAQGFVSSVQRALRDRGALLESLEELPVQEGEVEIDGQFLSQVERMCQIDMVASLREAGVSLDEHARNEELRGVVVTRLLEEMFQLVGLPMLPPPPQLVLAMPRPNDILPSSVEPMPDLSKEDRDELASHRFYSEASRVMANVLARCIRYTEKCDEQMTARMQRKNRQVMQRISRSQLYQRELFQALRDGHAAIRRSRMTAAFSRVVQNRPEVGIDPNVEIPVYFCSIVYNHRPGHLFLTYWNICTITRVPGFSPVVSVMSLEEIDAVEIVKLFVGQGIQVKKKLGGEESMPPTVPTAAEAAAEAAAKKVRPTTITFATTKVATAELRELVVALVRVHREPVTSPSTAERAASIATAAASGL